MEVGLRWTLIYALVVFGVSWFLGWSPKGSRLEWRIGRGSRWDMQKKAYLVCLVGWDDTTEFQVELSERE
jgi:hypothetical protein